MRLHGLLTTPLGSDRRAGLTTAALAALLLSAACSGSTPSGTGSGGAGPMSPAPGAGAAGKSGSANAAGGAGGASAGGMPSSGGSGAPSSAGGPAAVSGAGGLAAASGAGGLPPITNPDHCLKGYDPLPSDDTMKSGPAVFSTSSGDDTILQPEVLQWMSDNKWTGGHVFWHAFRGCADGSAVGLVSPLGYTNKICTDYAVLVPADQNCKTAGDGRQFLLFHRHMLQALKQLWPKHAADFDGFHAAADPAQPKFPTTKADLPEVWNTADPKWNAQILAAADVGDNIDKPENLAKFPMTSTDPTGEGALGFWLQCAVGTAPPSFAPQMPYIGLHFNLHDQWSRGSSSPHGLNNGQVNITNYMFWKLHGWIDKVWEKYRVARGLTTDPMAMQKYKQDLQESCNQMDQYIAILQKAPGTAPVLDCPPDVDETGYFHTTVRPIFETATNHCASCHGPSQSSPYASLTLGGQVSSKCIVERLKRASNDGGALKLIEPGDPSKSFLYLKASGMAATTTCTATDPNKPCNTATMPPGGKTMTDAELEILRKWIADGANYP